MAILDKWEDLTLNNNFIFAKVMLNEEICKKLLSEILGVKISKISYPEEEKTIDIRKDSRSVRLDVYLTDDESVYNIEMQCRASDDIVKRSRYYGDMIDLELIEKGEDYIELKRSYVIFICTFDIFGKGRYIYTFQNVCDEEAGLKLNDGTVKIFLNSKGTRGDISDALKDFLKVVEGEFTTGDFSDILKAEIQRIKESEKWRREYMAINFYEQQIIREATRKGKEAGMKLGIEEGRKVGIEEGRKAGIEAGREEVKRTNSLYEKLLQDGRIEDIQKAIKDQQYKEELYKEYEIV